MYYTPDPAELLTQFYPKEPYNFDAIPPGYTYGPIKSLIQGAITGGLNIYIQDVQDLKTQVTVQTATGVFLRNHGVLYGITPFVGESDDDYRARVLAAIKTGKLTIPAIQAAVQNYFNSLYGSGAPIIDVLDLQSNPPVAEAAGLLHNEFLIIIDYEISADDAFFLDYSYLDYTTYLLTASLAPYTPDSALTQLLNAIKSAGTYPVWDQEYTFT